MKKMSSDDDRDVRKVIGAFEMWDGRRAREVVASYPDGSTRREIEVGIDKEIEDGVGEEYIPRYAEIEDEDL
jgi:hypothetical protein